MMLNFAPHSVSYLVSVDIETPKKHRIFSTERFKSLTKRVKWRRRQADLSPLHELPIPIEKPLPPIPTEEYTTVPPVITYCLVDPVELTASPSPHIGLDLCRLFFPPSMIVHRTIAFMPCVKRCTSWSQNSEPTVHMSTLLSFRDLWFSDILQCSDTSSLGVVDETEAFTPVTVTHCYPQAHWARADQNLADIAYRRLLPVSTEISSTSDYSADEAEDTPMARRSFSPPSNSVLRSSSSDASFQGPLPSGSLLLDDFRTMADTISFPSVNNLMQDDAFSALCRAVYEDVREAAGPMAQVSTSLSVRDLRSPDCSWRTASSSVGVLDDTGSAHGKNTHCVLLPAVSTEISGTQQDSSDKVPDASMARPSFLRPSNLVFRSGSSDSSVEDLEINKPSEAPTASPIVTGVPSLRIPKLTRKKGTVPPVRITGPTHTGRPSPSPSRIPTSLVRGNDLEQMYYPLFPRCRPPSQILGNSVSPHPCRPGARKKKAAPLRVEHIVGPVLCDPRDESTIQKHQRAHGDERMSVARLLRCRVGYLRDDQLVTGGGLIR
ncbi:uncharacterized protein BT62DRAFT_1008229 [Guyanagaster necrorhizus]|uniref:Uncharacterized protein n=1 Tax=Guyanagaster necrorhizus TaxID=856835 RepID=A0A9P7VNQ3_9AGAR|nr:uncharacterized protein BT62DRAFT_1008229 [Guyanagaster necrorhizus MCA 3950]KAG7444568.1 hypothetical protein BT62DRAFT_1008229 [Guyanagaster necrorhizus MCA 3950]